MNREAENVLNERGKAIRDPVHSLIPIRSDEAYLLDLIDTPEFQRLRRIRQLGVSHITYPGAEHTRFSHSLGVLCFTGRILDHLARRYRHHPEILDFITRHERTIKAAALLHDTGHGPFSHMIERSFKAAARGPATAWTTTTTRLNSKATRISEVPSSTKGPLIIPRKPDLMEYSFPTEILIHDLFRLKKTVTR